MLDTYKREEQTLYYPNYPYNDLNADPFLNELTMHTIKYLNPWLVISTVDVELYQLCKILIQIKLV